MPYCWTCGTEVGASDHFCTKCGTEVRLDPVDPYGFLSAGSTEYIQAVLEGAVPLEPDDPRYVKLADEVAAGFVDLGMLSLLSDQTDILELLATSARSDHPDAVGRVAAFSGFIRVPELYDTAISTNWSADIEDWIERGGERHPTEEGPSDDAQ